MNFSPHLRGWKTEAWGNMSNHCSSGWRQNYNFISGVVLQFPCFSHFSTAEELRFEVVIALKHQLGLFQNTCWAPSDIPWLCCAGLRMSEACPLHGITNHSYSEMRGSWGNLVPLGLGYLTLILLPQPSLVSALHPGHPTLWAKG